MAPNEATPNKRHLICETNHVLSAKFRIYGLHGGITLIC